jgi:CoA:oxalate CoA-transferase
MQVLEGIKVVDLTQIYQGPYAAFLLAMAGADVVKVEPKDGERLRRGGGADTPMAFAMLNSNKKSLTLDLKHPDGKALLKSMVEKADILMENFAPGTMDRLGLGYDVLKKINPRLIYASATGYGLTGPDRDQLAMDHTIQAASGVMSVTGERGGPPARAGGTPCDIMGGIHLHAGILQALLGRERSGKGTLVEIAMMESMYFTLSSDLSHLHSTGEIPPRRGDKTNTLTTPYGRYECTDGWIAIICVAEQHWERILTVIGRTELIGDPDYGDNAHRNAREDEINAMIGAWCKNMTRDEAFNIMRDAKVPVAPIRDIQDVRGDAHMHQRGMLKDMKHPYMGDVVLASSPIRLSEFETSALKFFPEKGADTAAVLGDWLDLEDSQIAALSDNGVI